MNEQKIDKRFDESTLTLTNRTNLNITGVEKVNTVSDTNINLKASGSILNVYGSNLQVIKLDVDGGTLRVNGLVDQVRYNQKKENFLKRVFK